MIARILLQDPRGKCLRAPLDGSPEWYETRVGGVSSVALVTRFVGWGEDLRLGCSFGVMVTSIGALSTPLWSVLVRCSASGARDAWNARARVRACRDRWSSAARQQTVISAFDPLGGHGSKIVGDRRTLSQSYLDNCMGRG